ncbi:unnamed protein product [Polarella glacialis]|uniref:DUF4116 domain-containing protein n=1 Tax=Polarella glacialis TaxID=89957 RepID=A0A813GVR6_POLGL|nr:unnamed protein product [Polarella glacialis]
MGILELRIVTPKNKILCVIKADRGWRSVDLKEGICCQTSIGVIEQKLLVGGQELIDRALLDSIFPENTEAVPVTLIRRSQEQATWLAKCEEFGLQLQNAPAAMKADHDVVIAAVRRNWKALEFASEDLREDLEVALAALECDARAAELVGEALYADRIFVLSAVQKDWSLLRLAAEPLLADPDIVLAAVQGHWQALEWAGEAVWDYLDIPRAAAQKGGWAVYDLAPVEAQETLKADREFVLACVRLDWRCLYNVSEELRGDREIGIVAVHQDWRAMRLLHADLQGDREILESAVQQDWCCLTLALEEFPIELDLLIQIVQKNWQVFAHLPEAYKAEPQIVWAAVSQNWRALEFATKACKANPEIMMMAAHQNSKAIFLAEPELYANKQVVSFVVQLDGMLLRLASDDLKNDAEIVLQAVLQDWQSLQFASAEVRADQQVVFAAFVQDSTAFDWISPSLKLEPQVMHAFLRHDRTILDRLPDEIFLDEAFVTALANDDKFGHQTVVQLCQRNWQVLGLLPSKFQRDKKVILTCIEKDWQAIELVAERQLCQNVWADLDFVRAAVLQNAQCMSQAEDKIWDDSEIVISAMKQDIKIIDLAEEDIQEKLWNNEEVVMEAIKQDPKAIRKAAKGMWLQKDMGIATASYNLDLHRCLPPDCSRQFNTGTTFAIAAGCAAFGSWMDPSKSVEEDDTDYSLQWVRVLPNRLFARALLRSYVDVVVTATWAVSGEGVFFSRAGLRQAINPTKYEVAKRPCIGLSEAAGNILSGAGVRGNFAISYLWTAPAWDTAIRWLDMVVVDEADRLVAKWNKIQQRHRAWEGKVDPCMQLLKLIDEATEKSQRADCWQLVAASATMNRTTHRNLKFSSGIDIASVRAGGSALPEAGGGGQTGDGTSSWPSALRHMVTVARPYQFPKVMSVAAVTIGKLAADRLLVVLATTSDAGRAPSSIYSLNIVVAQLRLRLAEFGTFEVVTVAAAVEAAAALWTVEGSAQRKRRASGSREVVVADAQAVRGIHLDNIDAVVIIGDPISVGEYLHCAGRTCRFQPGHAEPTGGTVVSVVASNVADRMEHHPWRRYG